MSDLKFSPFPSDDVTSTVGPPRRKRSRRWVSIGILASLALALVVLTLMGLASASRAAPPAAPLLDVYLYTLREYSINPSEDSDVTPGQLITYIYEVTNLGNTSQSNVYVGAEDVQDIVFVGGDDNGNGSLDPGETWIYTGTATVSP